MLKSEKAALPIDIATLIFLILEAVLFPLIQFTSAYVSGISSYIAIVIVAIYALFTFRRGGSGQLIRLGILFTLVADYFLVLKEQQLEGVLAFILVQLAYFVYLLLSEERRGVRLVNVVLRIATSLVLAAASILVLGADTDALAIVSVIYYANLVVNAVFAFLLGKSERIFAIGLVLFAMCDLSIGLEVLFSTYLASDVLDFFYGANINLPWIFYQPSQVLIALRLYQKHRHTNRA